MNFHQNEDAETVVLCHDGGKLRQKYVIAQTTLSAKVVASSSLSQNRKFLSGIDLARVCIAGNAFLRH